jgi:hypothetical protein
VSAVGSDGYVATVTPAEAFVGGRPLQISLNEDGQALAQPRLVVIRMRAQRARTQSNDRRRR